MAKNSELTKEKTRLLRIFKSIDTNKLETAKALIDRAAFITVSLAELEATISRDGWMDEYQNGANQKGYKRSPAADCHIALTKNLNMIIKQLLDLTPPAERNESKLKALMRE